MNFICPQLCVNSASCPHFYPHEHTADCWNPCKYGQGGLADICIPVDDVILILQEQEI